MFVHKKKQSLFNLELSFSFFIDLGFKFLLGKEISSSVFSARNFVWSPFRFLDIQLYLDTLALLHI